MTSSLNLPTFSLVHREIKSELFARDSAGPSSLANWGGEHIGMLRYNTVHKGADILKNKKKNYTGLEKRSKSLIHILVFRPLSAYLERTCYFLVSRFMASYNYPLERGS